jgi:choline dehydrogenase
VAKRVVATRPDMQFIFIHVPFHPPYLQAPPNSYTFGIATVPDSRGWVRLVSADPKAPPLINPNYLAEDSDVRRLLLGVRKARELNAATAFSEWGTHEVLPGEHIQDEKGLRDFISRGTGTYYHPVAPARWAPTIMRSSIQSCACTASRACGSPMPR